MLWTYSVNRPPPKRTISKTLSLSKTRRRNQDELWRYAKEPIKQPLLKKLLDKEELAEEACITFLNILFVAFVVLKIAFAASVGWYSVVVGLNFFPLL